MRLIMVLAEELVKEVAKNLVKAEKYIFSLLVSEDDTTFAPFWHPTRFRMHLIAYEYGARCGLRISQRLYWSQFTRVTHRNVPGPARRIISRTVL
jgi:hypothetical protein